MGVGMKGNNNPDLPSQYRWVNAFFAIVVTIAGLGLTISGVPLLQAVLVLVGVLFVWVVFRVAVSALPKWAAPILAAFIVGFIAFLLICLALIIVTPCALPTLRTILGLEIHMECKGPLTLRIYENEISREMTGPEIAGAPQKQRSEGCETSRPCVFSEVGPFRADEGHRIVRVDYSSTGDGCGFCYFDGGRGGNYAPNVRLVDGNQAFYYTRFCDAWEVCDFSHTPITKKVVIKRREVLAKEKFVTGDEIFTIAMSAQNDLCEWRYELVGAKVIETGDSASSARARTQIQAKRTSAENVSPCLVSFHFAP